MGNALHLHSNLRDADRPEGNRERLGVHSDFLRLLECDLIIIYCFTGDQQNDNKENTDR